MAGATGLLLAAWLTAGPGSAAERPTILVLPFELVDTSLAGELRGGSSEAERRRLRATAARVRAALAAAPVEVVEAEPALTRRVLAEQTLRGCNGCERRLGRAADADLVLVGWVQKVSELILNINAVVREVESGRRVAGGSVSLRGNTDRSWARAADYLIERIVAPQLAAPRVGADAGAPGRAD